MKIQNAHEIKEAQRTIEQVLKVQSTVSEDGKVIAPLENADSVTDLLIDLRTAGIHLDEMSVQKPTLDEVFLTITGQGAKADKSHKSKEVIV